MLSVTLPPLMVAQMVCECLTSFHTDMVDYPERVFNPVKFILQCFVCFLVIECFLIMFTVYLLLGPG